MPLYKLGKYILVQKLNSGGMAEIYLAKRCGIEGADRLLAIKRILPKVSSSEEFIKMFVDEAKLLSKLTHPNIAQIYGLNLEGSTYYIAMELVEGKDLRAIFDRLAKSDQQMPIPLVCKIIADVCEGLDYAHNKCGDDGRPLNIVHRDVSLQNVIVSYSGQVKVIDFGVAKASIQTSETRVGVLKGKIGYMPPEQVAGQPIDRRGDVFAVGVMLWELLTNARLFKYPSEFQILERVRLDEIFPPSTINPKVSPELERIVLKALNRDPDLRYASASELHDDLLTYLISHRQLPSSRDVESFISDLFLPEKEALEAIKEEAKKVTLDTTGILDMSEIDLERKSANEDTATVQKVSFEATNRTSLSHSIQQSSSRRSGTNFASGAMSFFGAGETSNAGATMAEVSSDLLTQLRESLKNEVKDKPVQPNKSVSPILDAAPVEMPATPTVRAINDATIDVPQNGYGFILSRFDPFPHFGIYDTKQKLLYSSAGFVIFAVLIFLIGWLLAPAGTGTIIVTTEPMGVAVGLDSTRHACDTPCSLPEVVAGTHTVYIYMPGVEPVVRKVKIKPGEINTVKIP